MFKMNLPNKLTLFRVILVPFFVLFMELSLPGGINRYIALAIFAVASLTDLLDGKIARKYNLVTNFGKFMDPLADKLLVAAAMICLIGIIPKWVVIVIISREFIISGFRLIAAEGGKVIAAGWWGKIKTTVQMIMIIWLILDINFKPIAAAYNIIGTILIYASLILTIVSLIDYFAKNKNVIKIE